MSYPKRLMGWVRQGFQAYEVRLRHEPNLFQPNKYMVYKVAKVTALPTRMLFDCQRCPEVEMVYYRNITYPDGYTLSKGSEVMVEPVGDVFIAYNERGGVRLRLKAIPDNIR